MRGPTASSGRPSISRLILWVFFEVVSCDKRVQRGGRGRVLEKDHPERDQNAQNAQKRLRGWN